jgi:hypothetical protein
MLQSSLFATDPWTRAPTGLFLADGLVVKVREGGHTVHGRGTRSSRSRSERKRASERSLGLLVRCAEDKGGLSLPSFDPFLARRLLRSHPCDL